MVKRQVSDHDLDITSLLKSVREPHELERGLSNKHILVSDIMPQNVRTLETLRGQERYAGLIHLMEREMLIKIQTHT